MRRLLTGTCTCAFTFVPIPRSELYCRRLLDLPSTSEKNEAKAMLRELNQLTSTVGTTGRRRSPRLGRAGNSDERVV